MNSNNHLSQTISEINKMYDHLSYFDLYGSSLLFFILVTLIIFMIFTYFSLMTNAMAIKDDWVNQRCNPKVMPFAGFINKPYNKSITEFTAENFNFCTQNILSNLTGFVLQPFQFLSNFLLNIFNELQNATNQIRLVLSNLRTNMKTIAENILQRILNVMIPLQTIFMALMDSLQKTQGALTAGLYTSLGAYYTLKALLGAIVELIVKILIILVSIIVGLWVIPVTWPAAASMTAVFLAIAIPLAIIVAIMTEVLHIQSSGIPKLRCFDENTKFLLNNNCIKKIKDLEVGETLLNNNCVTAKFKLLATGVEMYQHKDLVISGTHIIHNNKKWKYINECPEFTLMENYKKDFIYCINTSNKKIYLKNHLLLDWDEFTKKEFKILGNNFIDIYGGFSKNALISLRNGYEIYIPEIKPGDILANGDIIYGIVELSTNDIKDLFKINLGNFNYFYGGKRSFFNIFKNDSDLNKNLITLCEIERPLKLYHLLTNSGYFKLENKIINDYNFLIDNNLNK